MSTFFLLVSLWGPLPSPPLTRDRVTTSVVDLLPRVPHRTPLLWGKTSRGWVGAAALARFYFRDLLSDRDVGSTASRWVQAMMRRGYPGLPGSRGVAQNPSSGDQKEERSLVKSVGDPCPPREMDRYGKHTTSRSSQEKNGGARTMNRTVFLFTGQLSAAAGGWACCSEAPEWLENLGLRCAIRDAGSIRLIFATAQSLFSSATHTIQLLCTVGLKFRRASEYPDERESTIESDGIARPATVTILVLCIAIFYFGEIVF